MGFRDVLGPELAAQLDAKLAEYNAGVEKAKHIKLVDLSEGEYVSKGRHADETKKLQDQITALKDTITAQDTSLADLNAKLQAAGTDAAKLAELQAAYADLEKQSAKAAADYEAKVAHMEYEQAVRTAARGLKFSSKAAEKDFLSQAIAHEFKRSGDTLEGFNDFVEAYKAADAGAFAVDAPPADPVSIGGYGRTPGGQKLTLSEMMAAKNADPGYVVDPSRFDIPTGL